MNSIARSLAAFVLTALVSNAHGTSESPVLDKNSPLGSPTNPVRANMPIGQRDYLMRLRCPEGDTPTFERSGSMGAGPYGGVIDLYKLTCSSGRTTNVVVDMYHRHREMEAIPGFTVLPEHPARLAPGCPPEVPGHAPGTYAFHMLEVETSARAPGFTTEFNDPEMEGSVFAAFVIGADGRVKRSSISFPYPPTPERLGPKVLDYLESFQFEPALHKPGCPVSQRAQARFTAKSK